MRKEHAGDAYFEVENTWEDADLDVDLDLDVGPSIPGMNA